MNKMDELLAIMAKLRDRENGCAWDIKQTFSSVASYTIEEAYEVVDAIDRNDMQDLKDELGDLLLQVVFHARMAQEANSFDFSDVVQSICDKLIRRHPHIFETNRQISADQVKDQWESIKSAERKQKKKDDFPESALDGVAVGLPEWLRAEKIQAKAASVGFDWPNISLVFDKLYEEINELKNECSASDLTPERLVDEFGDVLFVCANLARHMRINVSHAMRHANLKFERRFKKMEQKSRLNNELFNMLDLSQQEAYWQQVKQEEKQAN
jgi:ATP diphosphatase